MPGEQGCLAFVVHKHKARALHYDFRLEIGGKMPSWSIPKGPSLDPGARRLAMPTGPHDLEYRRFEGVIGSGYGAGAVMIWDTGTYDPELEVAKNERVEVKDKEKADALSAEEFQAGSLKFRLYGSKLQGSFALVRTSGINGRESWLLIKHRDWACKAGYDAKDYDFSAVSNLSLEEIAQAGARKDGSILG